ncbi:hypothetical protein [Mycobacterium sp.]|uniref:hypothetical protein n=1 Tax=Mycobacterium sp. TaxID=1785 RepID=UPI002D90EADD|nr:hypothetical protein [Mycobacterium sp.]
MDALGLLALTLGVLVAVVMSYFTSSSGSQRDPDMLWEGRLAAGIAAMVPVGMLWTGQVVVTVFATLVDGGIRPIWLWAWLLAAPVVGVCLPAGSLVSGLERISRKGSPGRDLHARTAAVAQAANFAWADTVAGPGWELRRTPPLPIHWPPPSNGSAVWLCYAERAGAAGSIELAGPWARITLTSDAPQAPAVERLSGAVEPIGWRSVQTPDLAAGESQAELVGAVRRGDPDGILARTLAEWRARNVLVAAQPTVAPHLPPAA